ncbi:hypothetical protein [Nocardioides houyundeii]|uniref:hypothetical protein n=1 Tax=Nocardioides houyundeii TaxID=2045452 RepID=UPI0013B4233B|nr:hypothetical protein [Nocardioides houyundeii]
MRDGIHRYFHCRNLNTNRSFRVYVTEGFALGKETVASIAPWHPSGWSMVSLVRLDLSPVPKLLAVNREPVLRPLRRSHPFSQTYQAEHDKLQRQILRIRAEEQRARDETARLENAKREEDRLREGLARLQEAYQPPAELLRRLTSIVEIAEVLADGPVDEDSARHMVALNESWATSERLPKTVKSALEQRLQQAHRKLSAALQASRAPASAGDQGSTASRSMDAERRAIAEEAESFAETGPWVQLAGRFQKLATRWDRTGAVDEEVGGRLWRRFENARLIAKDTEHRAATKAHLKVLADLEDLVASASSSPEDLWLKHRDLQLKWRCLGPVSGATHHKLRGQFQRISDLVISALSLTALEAYIGCLEHELEQAIAAGSETDQRTLQRDLAYLWSRAERTVSGF